LIEEVRHARSYLGACDVVSCYTLMRYSATILGLLAALLVSFEPVEAASLLFRGRVVMTDGSPPPKPVGIEYYCPGKRTLVVTITGKKGDFLWHYEGSAFEIGANSMNASTAFMQQGATGTTVTEPSVMGTMITISQPLGPLSAGTMSIKSQSGYEALAFAEGSGFGVSGCILRAASSGLVSSTIDLSDHKVTQNPQLPDIILTRPSASEGLEITEAVTVPKAAQKEWLGGMTALRSTKWDEAETHLRAAVDAAPQFGLGWSALALAYHNQHKSDEARDALEHAIKLDPKSPSLRFRLMRTEMDLKDWKTAATTAATLTQADGGRRFPDAYLDQAVIHFHLNELDQALDSATEQVRRDTRHELPRGEYILGLIYEARHDYPAAAEHMKKYLELSPKASDAQAVRTRIDNLGKSPATDVATQIAAALDVADTQLAPAGEIWIPGGIKALSALAGLDGTTNYSNFLEEFCQAIAVQAAPDDEKRIPGFYPRLQAFMTSVVELAGLGNHSGDTSTVVLSLADDAGRQRTARVLQLLGWQVVPHEGGSIVEPGDQEADGYRQSIPSALGIDEIAMKQDLEAGRVFRFDVRSENARLLGGAAWGVLLQGQPGLPGGLAEVFTLDWHFAKAYAGLSAMGADAASAVVAGVGLRAAVTRYADVLWPYAEAFAISNGAVVVPGGPEAEPTWTKLVGASPHAPPAFFRALIEKDRGNLASFYYELSRVDAAHQRFFTTDSQRATRFYSWYRDSGEVRRGQVRKVGVWRADVLQDLPLDPAGHVRFPGGRRAWTVSPAPDDDILLGLSSLEALVPMARIEERRGVPLDEESASLLASRYSEWKFLCPYFEELPGLGKAEFHALAEFTGVAAKSPPTVRNQMLGIWHSLVELAVLATQAGSLDPAAGARSFRQASEALLAADYPARARNVLREMVGGDPDVENAVADMLRLSGARRLAFDRVRALQRTPRIAALQGTADPATALAALSGLVYAALLGPDYLVVSEDPRLILKHQFVRPSDGSLLFPGSNLFLASNLVLDSTAPGSYFVGGFMHFRERAQLLARAPEPAEISLRSAGESPGSGGSPFARSEDSETTVLARDAETVFRTNARLVEVYATVTDKRGRHVDDLGPDQFAVLDNGKELPVAAFENRVSAVSCALLLDTTASMQAALPALKATALKLLGELRPIDSVAIYSFSDSVTALQPFTTDKNAAARAVLRTRAFGKTALYDALTQVSREVAGRAGKKVIVVFTDGADNLSAVTSETALRRAKTLGVPVYTIAQGDALESPDLLKQLTNLSQATGGVAFTIHSPTEIEKVFESITEDLMHGYLLAFQPPATEDRTWRPIEVKMRSPRGHKIRARLGYYPN
jgi:VWFA-related protein